MSSPLTLIAADIGNVNTKYRRQGGAWEIEPSLVRLFSTRMGYEFTSDTPVQPFVYVSGPAGIEANVPYLIGRDAQRAGVSDVALIGSAELRVHSAAYLLLHLYAIVASLPAGQTQAHIAFAGCQSSPYTAHMSSAIVHNRRQSCTADQIIDTALELARSSAMLHNPAPPA